MIFIKNPKEGQVKTRLGESVGSKKALEVYRRLLKITKSVTDQLEFPRQVWYSDSIEDDDIWGREYEKCLQSGKNLGDRMKAAFDDGFQAGYKNIVIIGSDCADLGKAVIEKAFEALEKHDIAIGPSKDGGYYLLGMSSFYPQLFVDKSWSTPQLLKQTLDQAKSMRLSYELLPELNDIDTVDDLVDSDIDISV